MKNNLIALMLVACCSACGFGYGKVGPAGPQGIPGPQGSPGPSGPMGLTGLQGAPCSLVGNVLTCPNGSTLTIVNGTNGTNAIPTTVVQFCKGYTTVYPSTFPEQALCIDNSLYAVYYDGLNAWLSEVVPGNYASTSTSAPCDFTVEANCVVVQ